MYKYFIKNKDNIADIGELRQKFPNCYFINGKFKGDSGVYAVNDMGHKNKEYGDHYPSADFEDVEFWEPTEENKAKLKIEDFFVQSENKFSVQFTSGQKVEIIPATAQPRKVLLGRSLNYSAKHEYVIQNFYNTTLEYGKLAFELVDSWNNDPDKLLLSDPKVVDLINMAMRYSFTCGIDVINCILEVSEDDLQFIFFAALGGTPDELQKKTS